MGTSRISRPLLRRGTSCEYRPMKEKITCLPTNPEELLTEDVAAIYLKILPRTLRLWRQRRGVPHIKVTSKVIRYRKNDLDRWLNNFAVNRGAL